MVHRVLCIAKRTLLAREAAHWNDSRSNLEINSMRRREARRVPAIAVLSVNRPHTGVFNTVRMVGPWRRAGSEGQGEHSPDRLIQYTKRLYTIHKKFQSFKILCTFRSLQLSERSPNRIQSSQKVVVKMGNVLKERPSYQQVRNAPSGVAGNITRGSNARQRLPADRYAAPSKDTRNLDLEKSRSLDSEYDSKYKYNTATDFDKSRSFDDDYAERSAATQQYLDDGRSFSNDQMYAKNAGKQNSPQTYGNRLYEHDMGRKTLERSPLLDYRRQQQQRQQSRNRDRSPNSSGDQMYRMSRSYEQTANNPIRRDLSPSKIIVNHTLMANHASPGSEYDVEYDSRMNEELIKEAKIVTEFLYGNKAKAEAYMNQRRRDAKQMSQVAGTPSSGRYIRN